MEPINTQQLITDHIDLWTGAIEQKNGSGRGSSRKQQLYGIKKLRELILELAVRGKLVPQDPKDEPASELLKRIAAEREQLVKEKKIKKPKKLPEITDEEKLFELPEGWEWVKLGRCINLISGQHLKPSEYSESSIEDGVPYITGPAEFGDIHPEYSKYTKEKRALAFLGDILITCKGSGIGKTNSADRTIAISRQLMAIQPIYITNKFIRLITDYLYDYFQKKGIGIAIPGISREDILEVTIGLPPKREQHRIVTKVEELMALCDQLEQQTEQQIDAHQQLVDTLLNTLPQSTDAEELAENWARLSQHFDTLFTTEASIDQLKQTILQLAVMGKLVPQNPNDEPAAKLLERIAEEKAQLIKAKKIKRQKALPVISEDEKPFELPEGWEWVRISEALYGDTKNGVSAKANEDPRGVPLLRISAATSRDDYTVNTDDFKLTSAVTQDHLKDYDLIQGDILAVRFNGNKSFVGRASVIERSIKNYIYPDKLIRIRLFKQYTNPFLMRYFINSKNIRNAIEEHCSTTVGNWGISAKNLKTVPIPLPPLNEQRRIVAKVNELFTLCDQLKERLQQNQQTQRLLTDTLVSQALS